MKKYTIRWFCADQIDVITNFIVITNVVIKRVDCIRRLDIHSVIHGQPVPRGAFMDLLC